jgi:type VI secretion system protein ImpJ
VKLKICEVLDSTPDGVISLDPDFVPTCLQVHASSYLLSCLKEVISMLGHRGDAIAERIRSNGKVGGAEVGDFMMLQLINRTEPLLRHYLNIEQVHPQALYCTLLTLLGELATFSSDSKRPSLDSRYEHSDQGASFRKLMEAVREVLSMVLEQHAVELAMQARQYGIMVSPLHDHKLLGSASFVLAASAQCDSEELRHRLPAHLKVGPVESIRQLVNLHLPGIKVRPLPVAPRQIAFHANKTYFILDLSPEDQAQLEGSGGFAFHVSGEFTGLEMKFWAIRN